MLDDKPITGLQVSELTNKDIVTANKDLTEDQIQKCPIILSTCNLDEDC